MSLFGKCLINRDCHLGDPDDDLDAPVKHDDMKLSGKCPVNRDCVDDLDAPVKYDEVWFK